MEPPVIIVADADGEAARLLADYLSRQGFPASHTSRGEDAIRLARSGKLGLAIVDVSLVDMSGHALASWLKQIDREIPILMTSGDYRPELEMRARQVGVLYYAHKPTDYGRLQTVVAKAVGAECG
ncbi:MAG: response regulator [Candidatus Rokubacteria bacterium]|nr:response regulator [Candidatus Rokubacteria bacterium]